MIRPPVNTRKMQGKQPASLTASRYNANLLTQLNELLQGERALIKLYSRALGCAIYLINSALKDPESLDVEAPVYTTRELAYLLSLSPEEQRKFHYFKQKLIG